MIDSRIAGAGSVKSISASFVVFSGALLLTASGITVGSYAGMRDIQAVIGAGTLLIGLFGWWRELSKDQQHD
jgi:hypothetical protein